MTDEFSLKKLGENIVNWRYHNFWTARGEVFDIGITTQRAVDRLASGARPDLAGDFEVSSNGNGSLMRILPLLFYVKSMPADERFETIRKVSAVTHGHIRSVIACYYYSELAAGLLNELDARQAYAKANQSVSEYLEPTIIVNEEVAVFKRILDGNIDKLPIEKIQSSGYVLHTLEASLWCLLNTSNYADAVLKAVNLGSDTDTTAAVTGRLAALLYGYETIPAAWIFLLARNNDIGDLADRLNKNLIYNLLCPKKIS